MTPSQVPKAKAIEWLREQASGISAVREYPRFSQQFKEWRRNTESALERIFGPGTRHVSELRHIRWSPVVLRSGTEDISEERFKRGLDSVAALLESCITEVETWWEDAMATGSIGSVQQSAASISFISPTRITELRGLTGSAFDVSRLIKIAEEIDLAFSSGSYHAVAALTRALIDHVPPIFDRRSFTEVANNYGGGKSFQDSMRHLDRSARAIADAHLHAQIRRKEVLPTATQVNFSNDLDVLLAEIVRILG